MKHLTILAIAVFITTISNAQTKNPSSNKEVQAKIKQAQQQLSSRIDPGGTTQVVNSGNNM